MVHHTYHNDHLGSPGILTDSAGSVVWQEEFTPFGEPLSVSGSITNNLRFPGQYFDSETGLHQNWHRDYMPEIGRYPEADPIGLKGGINPYLYSENNPVNWIDPMGLHMVSRPPYYNSYYHLACIDNHEHPNRDAVEGECFYDPPIDVPNWVCKMGVTAGCNVLCQKAGGKFACQASCRAAAALICPDKCE